MTKASPIRQARLRLGWSQTDLAQRVGVSQPFISKIERGHAEPTELVLSVLGLGDAPPRSPARQPLAPLGERSWKRPPEPTGALVHARYWQRPDASGDLFMTTHLPRGGLLVIAIDIAGHGIDQVPKVTYLQGWLRGWTHGLTVVPRLEGLVEDLEAELESAGLRAAWFASILSPQPESEHRVAYQAAANRFPSPLLVCGAPPTTLPSIGNSG